MPLETSNSIKGLQPSWPDGDDDIHEGDDHLRLIKSVLKDIFAGSNPDPAKKGFDSPITVDPQDINHLSGIRSNVQLQIDDIISNDNLIAPSGTIMMFQGAVPVGWTLVTGLDNRYLRVDSSSYVAGNTGGTDGTNFTVAAHTHATQSFTLLEEHIPPHNHAKQAKTTGVQTTTSQPEYAHMWMRFPHNTPTASTVDLLATVGGGNAHNHGNTSPNAAQAISPSYTNIVLARKT